MVFIRNFNHFCFICAPLKCLTKIVLSWLWLEDGKQNFDFSEIKFLLNFTRFGF